jgi:TetR/AcrR family transcriptional regulator, ethionamide resistance regulator
VTARPDVSRRHRERREQTRQRILAAARELLEQAPLSELSIEAVATRAELTRTAFYRHFDDLTALLLALLAELAVDLDEVADVWERGETDDPVTELRSALVALVGAFVRHGRLLRAIADASAFHPPVATAYDAMGAAFSASAAARIEADVVSGRSDVADPEQVAAALVWMNERYLLHLFGREPLGDPEVAAATLVEIWLRTVYTVQVRERASTNIHKYGHSS